MKGKSFGIPAGMIFIKFYCLNCGHKLEKEKNYRLVTKEDVDYFSYQDRDTYPRINHDVYDYHFKCKNCNNRYSYKYQCIINKIQKYKNKKQLSKQEIKTNFAYAKQKYRKQSLIRDLCIHTLFVIFGSVLVYLFSKELDLAIIMGVLLIVWGMYFDIKFYIFPHDRKRRNLFSKKYINYSEEEKYLVEYLYSFSFNNKNDVEEYDNCYCFSCNRKMNTKQITRYENEIHALCPYCLNRSILVEESDEEINESNIDLMNRYWF